MAHPLEIVLAEVRKAAEALNNATCEVEMHRNRATDEENRMNGAKKVAAEKQRLYDEAVAKMDRIVGKQGGGA